MKQTRLMMDMPITIEIADPGAPADAAESAFAFLAWVDATFSPYRPDSEISRINNGRLTLAQASEPVREIFQLADETREDSGGYFDIRRDGRCDPSGIVFYPRYFEMLNSVIENFFRDVARHPFEVMMLDDTGVPTARVEMT